MEKRKCTCCSQEKNIDEFVFKYKARGIRQSRCRSCIAAMSKNHYKNNIQMYLDKAKKRNKRVTEENRKKLFAYLSQHPCIDCGFTDIRCLEFDHVRGEKVDSIAMMLHNSLSWTTIEAEIAKCEVRCGNCHRIKTSERIVYWRNQFDLSTERQSNYSKNIQTSRESQAERQRRKRAENQQRLDHYLTTHPCVDCDFTDIRCLEFDHVRGEKVESISRLLAIGASWKKIEAEIAKCEVRCVNCHRIKTIERGNWWRLGQWNE